MFDTPMARRYRRETDGVQVPWPYLSVRGPSRRSGLCREVQAQGTLNDRWGIHVKRDSLVSVMYAEELNSITSSVTLQRTDRHGILGQKPPGFQLSL
jgi:hypothetical protein